MKPPPFRYFAARSIGEAVEHLAEAGSAGKVIAGGQSLVPLLNFRFSHPSLLIDVNRIPGLDFVEPTSTGLRLGALTRHRAIETSAVVRMKLPLLAEAAALIGHLAIRNRGTIGGSLAHADPAAELPVVAVLLDATIELNGPSGKRRVEASDFFLGPLTTAVGPDEIVTAVELPSPPPGSGHAFVELTRRTGDFAIVAAAAAVTIRGGRCTEARIALGGAAATAIRAGMAEAAIVGRPPGREAAIEAGRLARESADPANDLHASADFRLHLVESLTRRAVEAAFARAGREAA